MEKQSIGNEDINPHVILTNENENRFPICINCKHCVIHGTWEPRCKKSQQRSLNLVLGEV